MQTTLQEIATSSGTGNELVVQFIAPAETLDPTEAATVRTLASGAAAVGEPWFSYFTPADLEDHLRAVGFREFEHFGRAEAAATYLAGRSDGLRLPDYFRMIRASIG